MPRALAGKEMIAVYRMIFDSAAAWLPSVSMLGVSRLERAHRERLRVCTGLKKTTPTESVYLETDVVSINVKAKRKGIIAYGKAMSASVGDMKSNMCEKEVRTRLKAKKGWKVKVKDEWEKLNIYIQLYIFNSDYPYSN